MLGFFGIRGIGKFNGINSAAITMPAVIGQQRILQGFGCRALMHGINRGINFNTVGIESLTVFVY